MMLISTLSIYHYQDIFIVKDFLYYYCILRCHKLKKGERGLLPEPTDDYPNQIQYLIDKLVKYLERG
jgi:hypothetical protein